MKSSIKHRAALLFVLLASLFSFTKPASHAAPAAVDAVPQSSYAAMRWRLIGPHRGGRSIAACGVRGQPETFYFGAVGGGVWKTTDAGHVWTPIFDSQPIASIGALAVAPSDANVIYVGAGEADMRSDISFGDGMYKSTDAGKSWTHIGLRDTQQIARVLIDPRDANVVLVAALGHGFGANAERGVFRTTDGGKTWSKVLYKDENTGAIDLAADPDDARIIYAALWNVRRAPWSNIYAPVTGPGGGLYKSTDGGVTWRELKGHGLPDGTLGRIGLAVASSAQGGAQPSQQQQARRRVYALIEAGQGQRGLYRSDDAGETWQQVSTDARLSSRSWYFSGITVDPHDADTIYVSNVSVYRSTDAGRTFQTIKGAPGGDDYHALWIDPDNSKHMILASDQGTVISVDGGETWSSWYNQPTAQFYHVAVDTRFPYRVYGAQQDSGTAAVTSRSDYGQISFRDWQPIGAGESGNILPDPVNPDIVWGGSTGGETYRYDRRTGQVQDVTPAPDAANAKVKARYPWTTPIAFSPHAPYALYQASQFLFKTTNGGASWETISPDLTVREAQGSGAKDKASGAKEDEGKAVSYSLALSPVSAGTIWVGTDNGLIQLTRDEGRSWQNVSPKNLPLWSIVSLIDASPFDSATAYAAVDRHQSDDLKPYIFRTRDFGQTWTKITDGIPEPAFVRAVRADPARKGLLYAGTELGVYVSFDDGEHWQSLQLNLPVTSVRDLVVKDNDLVVATHGRSFWILDNITSLRQLNDNAARKDDAHLYNPAVAYRLRQNENRDTPLPPETPVGANPPVGAIIDYNLKSVPSGEVTLEILDPRGSLVRKFSSSDPTRKVEDVQSFPTYWLRPPAPPTKNAGHNRFVWNLRYAQPRALRYDFNIAAVPYQDTPTDPQGALVLPGVYQLRLTVNGRTSTAPLRVELDPRVSVPAGALEQQLALAMKIGDALNQSYDAARELQGLRAQLKTLQARVANMPDGKAIADAARALDEKAATLAGGGDAAGSQSDATNLSTINGYLAALMTTVGASDAAPTAQAASAFDSNRQSLDVQLSAWATLRNNDLKNLNLMLQARGMPAMSSHVVTTGGQ